MHLSHRMHVNGYLITIELQGEFSGHRTQGKETTSKATYPSQENHPIHVNHCILHNERAIRVILLKKRNFTIRQRALDVTRKYAASSQRTASQRAGRTSHVMWAEVSDGAAFYV